jgi:hypothetical protein
MFKCKLFLKTALKFGNLSLYLEKNILIEHNFDVV